MNNKAIIGCYPPRPSTSVDNTLLDLQNSSYPTHPHSIIANYREYPQGFMASAHRVLLVHWTLCRGYPGSVGFVGNNDRRCRFRILRI